MSDLTTEPQTRRFLREFVRYAEPQLVVETGCHDGETALEIGEELQRIAGAQLVTCDTESLYVGMTRNKVSHLPVLVHHLSGLELLDSLNGRKPDVVFVDSGDDATRVAECLKAFEKGARWVFLHDILRRPEMTFDPLTEHVNGVILPYGRGLGMFWNTVD